MKQIQRLFFTVSIFAVTTAISVLSVSACTELLLYRLYPRPYPEIVRQTAQEYRIPEELLYSVMKTESGFREEALSQAGALGLTQITRETFDWLKEMLAPETALTFEDLTTPDTAIRFGGYFLSLCLNRYEGDIPTAAAAYHSGWSTVDTLLELPDCSLDGRTLTAYPYEQMKRYVRKINNAIQQYQSLYGGEES